MEKKKGKHKSRSRDRDLAGGLRSRDGAISRSRDRAVDRDLDPARSREGEIAINGAISRTTLREIAPLIAISIRRDLAKAEDTIRSYKQPAASKLRNITTSGGDTIWLLLSVLLLYFLFFLFDKLQVY